MWSQHDPLPTELGISEEMQEQMILFQILNQQNSNQENDHENNCNQPHQDSSQQQQSQQSDVSTIGRTTYYTTQQLQQQTDSVELVPNTNIKFLNDVPDDILLMICLYLKPKELISLSKTCKYLSKETDSTSIKKIFNKCWQLQTKELVKTSIKIRRALEQLMNDQLLRNKVIQKDVNWFMIYGELSRLCPEIRKNFDFFDFGINVQTNRDKLRWLASRYDYPHLFRLLKNIDYVVNGIPENESTNFENKCFSFSMSSQERGLRQKNPLYIASKYRCDNMVKLLRDYPLLQACSNYSEGSELVELMLNKGANVNTCKSGSTPLYEAVRQGSLKLFNLLLEKYGANLNLATAKSTTKETTILMEASVTNEHIFDILISKEGYDVLQCNNKKLTTFSYAASRCDFRAMKIVFDCVQQRYGSETAEKLVNQKNNEGRTAYHLICKTSDKISIEKFIKFFKPDVTIRDGNKYRGSHFIRYNQTLCEQLQTYEEIEYQKIESKLMKKT